MILRETRDDALSGALEGRKASMHERVRSYFDFRGVIYRKNYRSTPRTAKLSL
jgi:hypothetical protein